MAVKILSLTTLNEGEKAALEKYLEVVGPLLEAVGAKVVERYEVSKVVAGTQAPQYVSLIEYPDHEAIAAVFESDAYKSISGVRDKAFSTYDIFILS